MIYTCSSKLRIHYKSFILVFVGRGQSSNLSFLVLLYTTLPTRYIVFLAYVGQWGAVRIVYTYIVIDSGYSSELATISKGQAYLILDDLSYLL